MELVYTLLRLDRPTQALPHLDTLISRRPDDLQLLRQRGFVEIALDMDRAALRDFVRITELDPADGAAWLTRGYIHARLDDRTAARAAYLEARDRGSPDISERADAELEVLAARYLSAGTVFADLYFAPQYQERFDNIVASGIARLGVIVAAEPRAELYGSLRLTKDSRSTLGAVPLIYSDNSLIPALGARLGVGPVTLFAEAGVAVPVIDGIAADDARSDFRGGLFHSSSWAPGFAERGRAGELYADAVYYSRFDDDVIASLIYRDGFRMPAGSGLAMDMYGRGGLVVDVRREFYNNLVEVGAGARLAARGAGAWLGVEYIRGWYLDDVPPAGRSFDDLRVILVISRIDILHRRGR